MNALYCGLDVHKNGGSSSVIDEVGIVAIERKLLNNKVILGLLTSFHPSRVAIEASTSIAPIYGQLVKEGYDFVDSHITKTRLVAESRIKTDRVDARALVELLRLDALPSPTCRMNL